MLSSKQLMALGTFGFIISTFFDLGFSEIIGWTMAFVFLMKASEYQSKYMAEKEKYESQFHKARISKNNDG